MFWKEDAGNDWSFYLFSHPPAAAHQAIVECRVEIRVLIVGGVRYLGVRTGHTVGEA